MYLYYIIYGLFCQGESFRVFLGFLKGKPEGKTRRENLKGKPEGKT
jgi:hypothetical protein